MRIIALVTSSLSVLFLSLTMAAGLKAAHGQQFFMSHLYWGFASLGMILLTLALCLMFIFKMHGILHELVKKLDEKESGR